MGKGKDVNKILTVSVAAYNAEKWLCKCLDSFVVPEVMDSLEVIIVNDGSRDNTKNLAAMYEEKYPNTFCVINKENGGHGSTINAAIPKATGKYFKIVDADDWVERDGLIQLVEILKKQDVDAVLSPYYKVDAGSGKKTRIDCSSNQEGTHCQIVDIGQITSSCSLAMHAITYRTTMLQEHFLPIDEKCFYVDLEYIVFYFRHVRNVLISDAPVYDYLVGTGEQSVNMRNMVRRREQHRRVCDRLLKLSAESACQKPTIRSVIESCIINHYRVLMSIEDGAQSREELRDFDLELRTEYPDLYHNAIMNGIRERKETAMAVFALRRLGFHGYGLLHQVFRVKTV